VRIADFTSAASLVITHKGLPKGWVWAEMQQVCSKVQDGTHFSPKDQSPVGDFKYITAKNIKVHGLDLSNVTYVPTEVHRTIYERCNPEKGDVLYIKDGATTGIATVNELDEQFSMLSSVALLKPRRDILSPNYLKWYLNSPIGFKAMTDQMTGSAITRLVLRTIRKSVIPLAPFPEQCRIVRKLETIIANVNACQKRLVRLAVLLKRFRQSVLAAACSGRLTADWREQGEADAVRENRLQDLLKAIQSRRQLKATTTAAREKVRLIFGRSEEMDSSDLPSGWRYLSLGKLSESFDYGTSAKSKVTGRTPVLRMGNIQNGRVDWTNLAYTSDEAEIDAYLLKPNTVLFNRTNSPELVGKTAIYRGERAAIFAGYLIRINPVPELNPEYLNLCLNSNHARAFCAREKTDGVSQSNINAQKLGTFEIPFCCPLEQAEIIRRVDQLYSFADEIEARYRKAKAHVDKVIPSVLAKAFCGELVPQDPNDEPASVLLARLRVNK
jgi:type I restriction enzyme, S subunit